MKEMDAFYSEGMFTNGLPTIQADELHSYEEGIQVLGQSLLLDYGDPKQLERAMETARAGHPTDRHQQRRTSPFQIVLLQRHEDGRRRTLGLVQAEFDSGASPGDDAG